MHKDDYHKANFMNCCISEGNKRNTGDWRASRPVGKDGPAAG